ncbi:hypothetical protein L1987_64640 [Smallanthus sonchifolius]|uniref:Uncharacterized protein n=1 Tax=Smallanthus sonchifolius TaxID=185202 RepID=A0ACB9BS51_9ASTR|nr:hypothetical protein L1987_64640 [Smallanthus sonchifolius]
MGACIYTFIFSLDVRLRVAVDFTIMLMLQRIRQQQYLEVKNHLPDLKVTNLIASDEVDCSSGLYGICCLAYKFVQLLWSSCFYNKHKALSLQYTCTLGLLING